VALEEGAFYNIVVSYSKSNELFGPDSIGLRAVTTHIRVYVYCMIRFLGVDFNAYKLCMFSS